MWVWFIRLQVPSTLLLRCHWKATIHAVVTARRCLKELNWKWFTLKFRKIQRTHLILTLWWPTSASMSWVFLLSWVTKSLCSQAGSSPSPRTWLGPHRWDITFRVNATVSSLFILETGLEGIGKSVASSSPTPPTLLRLAWRVKNPAQANEISEMEIPNLSSTTPTFSRLRSGDGVTSNTQAKSASAEGEAHSNTWSSSAWPESWMGRPLLRSIIPLPPLQPPS